MSWKTGIQSNLDDVIQNFIDSLMSFNKPFYDRLREYTINVIGSGNLGEPYVLAMAAELAKPKSMIKKINWFTREHLNKAGENKTLELRKRIENEFNYGLHDRRGKHTEGYNKIMENVAIKGFTKLSELRDAIKESENDDTEKYGNLTVILTDYNTDFLYNIFENKRTKVKRIIAKTRDELKSMKKSKIIFNANTMVYKNFSDIDERLDSLMYMQELTRKISESVNDFCNETGIMPSRFSHLTPNLIGNMALAKALEGYNGTVLSMTNPVESITQQFAFHSKIPVNRIVAPIENDYCRLQVLIRRYYYEVHDGKYFKGRIEVHKYSAHTTNGWSMSWKQ